MRKLIKNELLVVFMGALIFSGLIGLSIGKFSIWHDESYSATLIESSYSGIIERTGKDVHPPLYYLLLKSWSNVFGHSIVGLRLFSSVTMLGAIILTWLLIRKIYGQKKALIALLIMFISPFLVRYGQEMRMYGLAAFLASLSTYWYVQSLNKSRISIKYSVAYGLITALGIYTQYFFVLVPLTHIVHMMLATKNSKSSYRHALKPYIISMSTAALILAPWVPTVVKQYSEVQGAFWIGPVSVETLTSTPIAMTIFVKQFEATGYLGLLACLSLITVALLIINFRKHNRTNQSKLLELSVLVPPAALFVLSLPPFQPSYQDRYMSFFAPIFYSILALGAISFKNYLTKIVALVSLVVILSIGQYYQYRDGNNHGWSPKPHFTMNQIAENINDDSPVYSTSLWTFFDAHITLENKPGAGVVKLLSKDYPTHTMGNWSAIYGRDDLMTTTIPANTHHFWLIDEVEPKYNSDAFKNYRAVNKQTFGYATLTEFFKN